MPYLLTAALLAASPAASEEETGFVPLFNGKDLTGWEVKENRTKVKDLWTVKGGVLTAKAGSGWLGTKKVYGDFVLRLEWRIPVDGNSGVYVRVPALGGKETPSQAGVEVQVLDDEGPAYKGKIKPYQHCGSIYGIVAPRKSAYRGAGKWNAYEITCKGGRIRVVFNGELVAEADADREPKLAKRPRKGFIGLQNHGYPVEFRNIRIKVLDK